MGTSNHLASGPIRSEFASDPDLADVVRKFVEGMPEKIAALRTLWHEQSLDEVRRLAHQLKGASGGYGFGQLGDAAARLESTINALSSGTGSATTQHMRAQFDELVRLCGRVSN